MPQLLSTPDVAKMLGVTAGTLEQWRVYGRGPAHIRVGRLIKYDIDDIKAWLASQRVTSTSDAA